MGAVLEQYLDNAWKPLSFFTVAQCKYSAYDRELITINKAIKYFRHLLEGRNFKVVTDHKPLIYAFLQRLEIASPRQLKQLSFISQFTTRLEHVMGSHNVDADSLSRVKPIRLLTEIELAEQQKLDDELRSIRGLSAFFETYTVGSDPHYIILRDYR